MRLVGKQLLFLVSDGVSFRSFQMLRRQFEKQGGEVFVTTPEPYLTVETVYNSQRGKDIPVDIPIELVDFESFDCIVVPDGSVSVSSLVGDESAKRLLLDCHECGTPIVVSGEAGRIAGELGIEVGNVADCPSEPNEDDLEEAVDRISQYTSSVVIGRKFNRFERVMVG